LIGDKMDKCKKCGADIVKYPYKDENGKIIWKNLFKMDMMSILFLICVIFMLLGHIADMSKCNDAIKYPCTFCEKTNCCLISKDITNKSVTTKNSFVVPNDIDINK